MSETQPKVTVMVPGLIPPAVWIPAVVTLIGLIVAPFLTYWYGLKSQLELTGKQKRQQAYSELMERKVLLKQLWTSQLVAVTNFYYHNANSNLAGGQTEGSFDLEEGRRWQHKSEDLTIEIAKSYQSLFETLGLIRSYFPYSVRLIDLTNKIYHSNWLSVKRPHIDLTAEQIKQWKEETYKKIQEDVREYDKIIDDLVTYLEYIISK